MGYDYTSIHLFGGENGAAIRSRLVERLSDALPTPVDASEASRSLVIGPTARWLFLGDTASQTEEGDPPALAAMIELASFVAPTLSIHMSDSACVHLYLRHNGKIVDQFGTGIFPFYPFSSEEEAASYRGSVEKWLPYSLRADAPQTLRDAWDTKHNARGIVRTTAEVLGIHSELAQCGYTTFDEAEEIHYSEWVEDSALNFTEFTELHYA